ncbi:MAG: proline--tRNA ligase [Spirochaetia bacterium]
MRYSQLFPKTMRGDPRRATSVGYRLLYRGGYVRSLGKGLFSYLPLGMRVVDKLQALLRDEMNRLGGQEVRVPMVNPMEIWEKSGRSDLVDADMIHFEDRLGRSMVLAPTHEEAMVEMLRCSVASYRDLPVFVYQFQEKYRNEERTRNGLVRSREFVMKDGYSFHNSFSDLNNFIPRVFRAYERVFAACNLDVIVAEAGVGYMGGERSYEFLFPSEAGDDFVMVCNTCGYAANREVAVHSGVRSAARSSRPREMKKIDTAGCDTMNRLSDCLSLPKSALAKTMVFSIPGDKLVMAVVRGDNVVSVEKLTRLLGVSVIRQARRKELIDRGLYPGFVSPLFDRGQISDIPVVVDHGAADTANLVYGGNQDGVHFADVNFGRDFDADLVGDIARAEPQSTCSHCGGTLEEHRATELGNIFRLGTLYSKRMDFRVNDEHGRRVHPYMGSYGIGIGRLVQTIAEYNHDENGIIWPVSVTPFDVYLMVISKGFSVNQSAESLVQELGDTALFDDRAESIGTKFKDFLLLGIPFRVIVSTATVTDGTVELFDRRTGSTDHVAVESVKAEVDARLERMRSCHSNSHKK